MKCPCGSKQNYGTCCAVYHDNLKLPPTPEALMRSRYTAYALAKTDYIKQTMQGKPLTQWNEIEAKSWAVSVTWLRLNIIKTHNSSSEQGYVEFIARFIEQGQHKIIHEISEFRLINGQWFYVDGVLQ